MPEPVTRTVTVNSENGLHLVPCSLIAQRAREYTCELTLRNGDNAVDAKNVLELMTLAAEFGTRIEIAGTGDRADEAVRDLVGLFESNFAVEEPEDA